MRRDGRARQPATRWTLPLIFWLASSIVATAWIASSASAQADYGRRGFYVGARVPFVIESFDLGTARFSNGGGIDLRTGYRINKYLAAELHFGWATGFDASGVRFGPGLPGAKLEIETFLYSANIKGFFPIGRVHPYAIAGMGALRANARFSPGGRSNAIDFAFRAGGGIDFYVTEKLVLDIEVTHVLTAGDVDGLDFTSIGGGFQFRF